MTQHTRLVHDVKFSSVVSFWCLKSKERVKKKLVIGQFMRYTKYQNECFTQNWGSDVKVWFFKLIFVLKNNFGEKVRWSILTSQQTA